MAAERTTVHVVQEELIEYLSNELNTDRVAAIELHMADCDACAHLSRQTFVMLRAINRLEARGLGTSFRAAHGGTTAAAAPALAELAHTTTGWVIQRAGHLVELVHGLGLGDWTIGNPFAAAGVSLGDDDAPVTLKYRLPETDAEFSLQLSPFPDGAWEIGARLTGPGEPSLIVVGLGTAERPTHGSRTVTVNREQSFFIPSTGLAMLWAHLEWRIDDAQPRTVVLRIPARVDG